MKGDQVKSDRQVMPLRVAAIHVSKWNPRRIDPDDPATRQLAESMAGTAGLIQPIAVRTHPTKEGEWELLAGSRRLAAARLLRWEDIPAEVFEVDDATAVSIIVIENLQRKELSPLEEAAGLKILLERGDDHETIARNIGWPLSRVARRAQLLKLIPEWFELGKHSFPEWTASHFELIARLPEEQQRSLAVSARKDSWAWRNCESVPDLEKHLMNEMRLLSTAPWDLDDAALTKAGACNRCPKRASERPELFWDESEMPKSLQGHDRCLHAACWSAKLDAYLDARVANLKTQHPKLVLINSESWSRGIDMPPVERLTSRHKVPFISTSSDYARTKKSDPQALPAVVVLGKGKGTFCYVKKRSGGGAGGAASSTAGTVRSKTLKEKEEQLAAKRWNWIIDELIRRVRKDPLGHFSCQPIGSQRLMVYGILLSMEPTEDFEPLVGGRGARICRRETLFGEKLWRRYDEVSGSGEAAESDWLQKVWERECIPRIAETIGKSRVGRRAPDKADRFAVGKVCDITRVATPEDLQNAAAKQFPEPKAWAQQRQAAQRPKAGQTSKSKGSKSRRKSGGEEESEGAGDSPKAGRSTEIIRIGKKPPRVGDLQVEVRKCSDGRWRCGHYFTAGHCGSSSPVRSDDVESYGSRDEAIDKALDRLREACEGHARNTGGVAADARAAAKSAQVVRDFQDQLHKRKPSPGTCRVCGCTHTTPCIDSRTGMTCAWADRTQTLCTFCKAKEQSTKKPARTSRRRGPNPDFMKPMHPSPELAAIVGNKAQARTEITKKLWRYITKHELQDSKNRRMINTDEKLRAVMGGNKQVSMFDMTKHVSKHLK